LASGLSHAVAGDGPAAVRPDAGVGGIRVVARGAYQKVVEVRDLIGCPIGMRPRGERLRAGRGAGPKQKAERA